MPALRQLLALPAAALCLFLTLAAEGASAPPAIALDDLRRQALDLVNQARGEQRLPALQPAAELDRAAQAHAEDMLRHGYYGHDTPKGRTPRDRYLAAGGSPSSLVEENIARCLGCPARPDSRDVNRFQAGWMASTGHRANILGAGIEGFGFGIAGGGRRPLYAVQDFAGPGVPGGGVTGPTPLLHADLGPELPPERLPTVLAGLINAARARAGVPPLAADPTLTSAASSLVPSPTGGHLALTGDLLDALPAGRRGDWQALAALASSCGGCGTMATEADLRFATEQWLGSERYRQDLLDPRLTRLGFALRTDGAGAKTGLALLGRPR